MTHASLCKKTHERSLWFQGSRAWQGLRAIIFLASAALLSAQQFTITTTSLPNGSPGVYYSQTLQTANAQGMPTWSIANGSLPPGFSIGPSTGTISGTPSGPGNYSFQVEAQYDFSSPTTAFQNLSIDIAGCTPTITPSTIPAGDVGVPYQTIHFETVGCSSSYNYTFSMGPVSPFNPNVPPGLDVSTQGQLTGTPTAAGTYSFLLSVVDQYMDQTQIPYQVTFYAAPTITTTSLPNAPVGVPYSQQITATGGQPPYAFSMDGAAPGITITQTGVLQGTPTQAGIFAIRIGVTDQLGGESSTPFNLTFGTPTSQVQVSPSALTFNATLNGPPPPTQAVAVVPSTGSVPPVTYSLVIDNGQAGGAAPSWITVTPASGGVPVGLVVSVNQGTMPVGTYTARIQVVDTFDLSTDVTVTLNVTSGSQQLTTSTSSLDFFARSTTPGSLTEEFTVASTGAGTPTFTTSVVKKSSWITSVTPSSSSTSPTSPVYVQVQVNTQGLAIGAYTDSILLSSSAGNVQIPVSLFVSASGPVLGLDTTGVFFQAVAGGGSTWTQTVKILNLGDVNSTVNWTANIVSGSNWLSLGTSTGTATSSNAGSLTMTLAPNATSLAAGPYYATIRVTDANSHNSPQYITAVYNLEPSTSAPSPNLSPPGLFFTSSAGTTTPTPQTVQINASSAAPVTFLATASTPSSATWLSVSPASGTVSGTTAGSITVSVNPTGLAAGVYTGNINVSIGALLESVNITYVVTPGASPSLRPDVEPRLTGCTPSKVAITENGLANNFAVPAGWPATLVVQLNDDCASPITSGAATASFSNGDPALLLAPDNEGNYSATWQPSGVSATMVVTINATAGALTPAVAKLYGGIATNPAKPPVAAPNATVNNFNPVAGGPLSPGTIAQVYGAGLSPSSTSTGAAPLPTMFDNTFALVGLTQAPLYFLSNGQINIQIPNDATITQQTPIVLSVNNALTLPFNLNLVPAAPGVLSAADGPSATAPQDGAHIIAQHSADFSLVSSSSPAVPGEFLTIYLVGMGATNPSVASGVASPSSTLAAVVNQPTVTVGGVPATVQFAGLTPGYVGLYQINIQVPSGLAAGEREVDVSQNGVAANPTMLPVGN